MPKLDLIEAINCKRCSHRSVCRLTESMEKELDFDGINSHLIFDVKCKYFIADSEELLKCLG